MHFKDDIKVIKSILNVHCKNGATIGDIAGEKKTKMAAIVNETKHFVLSFAPLIFLFPLPL